MIKQRFLYVGIGGSGLDIGRELSDALTKEICGLDGRRLMNHGGPFVGFERGQLPSFVQSLYLDFSVDALDEIQTHLRGKNAVAVTNILPPHSSYNDAADFLRSRLVPGVTEWIPPKYPGSPNPAPLIRGAAQLPTVGRTALMAAMKHSGYAQTLGQQLGGAIDRLGTSLGQLTSYAGDVAHAESVAVYVGFSLSGGTGCGVFYDVLHLLHHELVTRMPDVSCTIMPIIIMPSLFDDVLTGVNKRNTQLNAATALLDLSRLMDLFNSPDPAMSLERRVTYPWTAADGAGQFKSINLDASQGKTSVKVATLIGKSGGLRRKDVYRSIASAIVSQVSTIAEHEQVTMGFLDKLVNDNEIRDTHHTLLGRRNIMPTVSASLTLPSERLTEVISHKILADGLSAQLSALPNRNPTLDEVKTFLVGSGQGDLVQPRTFEPEVGLEIRMPASAAQSKNSFNAAQVQVRSRIATSRPQINKMIANRIFEIRVFDVYAGLRKILEAYPDRNLADAVQIGFRAAALLSGGVSNDGSTQVRVPKKGRRDLRSVLKRKAGAGEIERWVNAEKGRFTAEVQAEWWTQWSSARSQWEPSVTEGRRTLEDLQKLLREVGEHADEALKHEVTRLQQPTLGVVEFLPTESADMAQTVDNMIRGVKNRLRQTLMIKGDDESALLSAVMRRGENNSWVEALRHMERNGAGPSFVDRLLDPVREEVQSQLPSILPSLSEMLQLLATALNSNGPVTQGLDQLRAKLAGLIPSGVIPAVNGAKPRVLVTYPGIRDANVQAMIKKTVFGHSLASGGEHGDDIFQWAANPDGSSLTATVNIVGQGLLDGSEVRDIMKLWIEAYEKPVPTDHLSLRQRVGYHRLRDLTDVSSRRLILRNFLAALYDGHVTIVSGSLTSPEVLRVRKEHTDTYFDVRLSSIHGASPWASFFSAFEKVVVMSSAFTDVDTPEAIKWFGTYTPRCLFAFEDREKPGKIGTTTPSEIFEQLVSIANDMISNSEELELPKGLAEEALLHHHDVRDFWTREVPEALLAPYLESRLSFWSLAGAYGIAGASQQMKKYLEPKFLERDADVRARIREEEARRASVISELS